MAWNTTPWTLPSNLALCTHTEFDYIKIRDVKTGKQYIVLEARVSSLYPKAGKEGYKGGEFEVLGRMKGSELLGMEYTPLYDCFAHLRSSGAFRVLNDTYVTSDAGTPFLNSRWHAPFLVFMPTSLGFCLCA